MIFSCFQRRAERRMNLEIMRFEAMSLLADSITRLAVSVDKLAAAAANIPPPVDESAVAAAVNAQADRVDAVTASLPHA